MDWPLTWRKDHFQILERDYPPLARMAYKGAP
jgi:hypothetical protein